MIFRRLNKFGRFLGGRSKVSKPSTPASRERITYCSIPCEKSDCNRCRKRWDSECFRISSTNRKRALAGTRLESPLGGQLIGQAIGKRIGKSTPSSSKSTPLSIKDRLISRTVEVRSHATRSRQRQPALIFAVREKFRDSVRITHK